MRQIAISLGLALVMAATVPAAGEQSAAGGDRQKLVGVWRLVSITEDGKVNPLRGGKPTGYIFYTASGEMGAMIQPERAPIAMAGKAPSGPEAQAALKGFTAYFGTYIIDETTKIVTHHRKGSVQPGYEAAVLRRYRFETPDRVVLGNPAGKSALVWERVRVSDVLMPQLGETVAEGKITKWFKATGDAVKPGDNLFEIETDKVSMEVPAIVAGTLSEIRVPEGAVAPVGAVVAVIAGEGAAADVREAPAAPLPLPGGERVGVRGGGPQDRSVTPSPQPSPLRGEGVRSAVAASPRLPHTPIPLDPFFEVRTPERNFGPARLPGGTVVTPLARRLASEAGIDLSRITPSGPHGRIVARDVEAAARVQSAAGVSPAAARGPSAAEVMALYRDVPFTEVALDSMRKTIAARLTQAKQTIPHFYLTADVEIGQLLKLREEANTAAPKSKDGTPAYRLSVNDLIIKMWAAALQRVPAANAVWAEDRILRFTHSDIGIAVAIEGGLITPVIRQAERKTLTAISAEMRELGERARAKKLKPGEYQGGASAISNLGMYGVREFSAIINPPHATILAVGASRRQAVERDDGSVGFASVMTVTLSCDHRVVDGALGAELLAAFKALVEQPVTALV